MKTQNILKWQSHPWSLDFWGHRSSCLQSCLWGPQMKSTVFGEEKVTWVGGVDKKPLLVVVWFWYLNIGNLMYSTPCACEKACTPASCSAKCKIEIQSSIPVGQEKQSLQRTAGAWQAEHTQGVRQLSEHFIHACLVAGCFRFSCPHIYIYIIIYIYT